MTKQEKSLYDHALIELETACMVTPARKFISELINSPMTLKVLNTHKIDATKDDTFAAIVDYVILLLSNKTYRAKLKQLIK